MPIAIFYPVRVVYHSALWCDYAAGNERDIGIGQANSLFLYLILVVGDSGLEGKGGRSHPERSLGLGIALYGPYHLVLHIGVLLWEFLLCHYEYRPAVYDQFGFCELNPMRRSRDGEHALGAAFYGELHPLGEYYPHLL